MHVKKIERKRKNKNIDSKIGITNYTYTVETLFNMWFMGFLKYNNYNRANQAPARSFPSPERKSPRIPRWTRTTSTIKRKIIPLNQTPDEQNQLQELS